MSQFVRVALRRRLFIFGALGVLLLGSWQASLLQVSGAQLGKRSLTIGSSQTGAPTDYLASFNLSTPGTLGSIEIEFCSNTPLLGYPCTVPLGMDVSNAVLGNQTGQTGFSVSGISNPNTIILTRVPGANAVGPVSYDFSNVLNPQDAGSYYARIKTFSSTDASGSFSDYGSVSLVISNVFSINAEVPPYLIFCAAVSIPVLDCSSAAGDYLNFGEFSSGRTSLASSQMLTATNAKTGYNITVSGTTLTSGNNTIAPLVSSDVSRPGSGQFGINLRSNVSPGGGSDPSGPGLTGPVSNYGQANFFRFVSGDIVISSIKPDDVRRYTVSYVVNVPKGQAPGVYVSTVTYICLGNF